MSAEEKLKLIEKITHTDNPILIREINHLIDVSENDKIYSLSEKQLDLIQAAEEDIKYKKTLSHKEAKEETEKWFGK